MERPSSVPQIDQDTMQEQEELCFEWEVKGHFSLNE